MQYLQGNLFDAEAEALVNTVNLVGVMGKGIALQFKEQYPLNFKKYKEACQQKTIDIGKLLVVRDGNLNGEKWIINFPTKKDWKHKSKIDYIEAGLQDLVRIIQSYQIKSIALPPLGTGNGGLDWQEVKPLIDKYLGSLESTKIFVYEPNDNVKTILQRENATVEQKLTPARAILLYAMFYYEIVGEDVNVFVANKLAYFLQRLGENLRISFKQHHYGPYSPQVQYVLYALNGKYLKGLEQNQAKPFEPLQLNYNTFEEVKNYIENNLNPAQKQRLDNLISLITGFESFLSLEILSSIDFISQEQKDIKTLVQLTNAIKSWSGRKAKLFDDYHIKVAYNHLQQYQSNLNIH